MFKIARNFSCSRMMPLCSSSTVYVCSQSFAQYSIGYMVSQNRTQSISIHADWENSPSSALSETIKPNYQIDGWCLIDRLVQSQSIHAWFISHVGFRHWLRFKKLFKRVSLMEITLEMALITVAGLNIKLGVYQMLDAGTYRPMHKHARIIHV